MEPLLIESTNRTPLISLSPAGKFKIHGRSIHENPAKFFEPVIDWMNNYVLKPEETTVFDIKLEYFNSSSQRFILDVLRILTDNLEGKKLIINWHYESGDDDLLERGQYYESILNKKFNLIEFE
ncbi:MAG: DUF1987 domain-containing protein [Marinilabiliales bacterium]|nr:MAG: DUF1987 domain-containing protein [Marinilabiliales bacterium]